MNEQLRLLVELQKLDSIIISKSQSIKDIPLKISSMQSPLKEARDNLQRLRQKFDAAEKKKKDEEQALSAAGDRILKLKAHTDNIKDNKAYQAHLKEIQAAEEQVIKIEDRILALMEAIEEEGTALKTGEAALKAEEARMEEHRKVLEAEVRSAEDEVKELKARRKDFIAGLDTEYIELYMSLLTIPSLAGLAVVEASGEVCGGCNMNIMPQLFVEVKKNERIFQCPQCRRILFYKEPPPEQ